MGEINTEEIISKLKELQNDHDTEIGHGLADDILCDLLTELGYQDIVEEYVKIPKWFA